MTTRRDLARLRLAAQRIAAPDFATAADAVTWMTAVQAQEFGSSVTATALRVDGGTRAGVEAALDAGTVVRSWPMRGTLHLVPAVDLAWLLTLGPPRVATTVARRQRELEIDDTTLDRAAEVASVALPGRRDVTRDGLMSIWNDAGIETTGQRGYHLLVHLAHAGLVCLGPMVGRQQAVVLVADWIPDRRHLERDEALGELVRRYFCSHGPAQIKDFTWWTGLRVADAKVGLAVVEDQLERLDVDGVEFLMDPATPDRLAAHRSAAKGVFLLPAFDEFVLGYADRGAFLPSEFADHLAPGGNGVFRPTVVADGQIVGTWTRTPARDGSPIGAPFTTFTKAVARAIPRRYAALADR